MTKLYYERNFAQCLEGQVVYIYNDRSDNIIQAWVNRFEPIYYHKSTRRWEVPFESFKVAMTLRDFEFVNMTEPRLKLSHKCVDCEARLELISMNNEDLYFSKTDPDPHQIEAYNVLQMKPALLIGDPMGLGKTKEYLDINDSCIKEGSINKVLFICKAKHKANMLKEINKHSPYKGVVIKGANPEARLKYLRIFHKDPEIHYGIIGYESACIHARELYIINNTIGIDSIILDEVTMLKNWFSGAGHKENLTQKIVKLVENIQPDRLILGSGTPLTKRPQNLYAIFRLLGIWDNYWTFCDAFCYKDSFKRYVGSRDPVRLHKMLWSNMLRRPKEILKLPEPRYNYMAVEMSNAQKKIYDAVVFSLREELKDTKVTNLQSLAKLTRLRQVTTSPALIEHGAPSIKEAVLTELVEDIINAGDKVLILSIYREETLRLKKLLAKYCPAYIDGMLTATEAQAQVDKIQDDPSIHVLIGTIPACQESYTMTSCQHIIFVDLSWTVTDNEQAVGRLYRRGQTTNIDVTVLYCVDSIDERVLDLLNRDSSLIQEVMNNEGTLMFDKQTILNTLLPL